MVGYAIYLKKRKKKAEEWLQKLLKSEFFDTCNDHQRLRKNDINLFCIDCYQCFCQHCLSTPSHCAHKLLQIRRYVYHNVVCIHDMQKHLDCSRVQPYTLNNSKVVFLNPRPQLKPNKSNNGACCKVCQRSLSESNQYCSIACKVSANLDKSNNRNNSSFLSFPIPEFRDIYVEEEDIDTRTDTTGTTDTADDRSSEDSSMIDDDGNQYWVSKSGVLKPKKQCHKRKGVPHRAPLC